MRKLVLLVAVVGCSKKTETKAEPTGSAAAPVAAAAAADAAAAPAPGCNLDGAYRLRFESNGAKGWWLRMNVTGTDIKFSGATNMLGLDDASPAEVKADPQACALTISKHTKQAGDLRLALTVADAKVTGTVARTDQYGKGTTPIVGIHDVKPEAYPACIKPGVYEVNIKSTSKWKTVNKPKAGPCDDIAEFATPHVRVELFGGELQMDYLHGDAPYGQEGGAAKLTKTADCEYDLELAHQDLDIKKTHIVFTGEAFSGKTTDATVDMMEETDEGENQATCTSKDATITGKRLGD